MHLYDGLVQHMKAHEQEEHWAMSWLVAISQASIEVGWALKVLKKGGLWLDIMVGG